MSVYDASIDEMYGETFRRRLDDLASDGVDPEDRVGGGAIERAKELLVRLNLGPAVGGDGGVGAPGVVVGATNGVMLRWDASNVPSRTSVTMEVTEEMYNFSGMNVKFGVTEVAVSFLRSLLLIRPPK